MSGDVAAERGSHKGAGREGRGAFPSRSLVCDVCRVHVGAVPATTGLTYAS